MRLSVYTMILSLATMLFGAVSAVPALAEPPGECQVSGDLANDVAAQGQCDRQPSGMAGVFDRFCNSDNCAPCWTFTADGLVLQRSTTRSQSLFQDAQGADLLNSQRLNFPSEMGLQASAIRHGPCGWDVEVGYFQIDGWAANATLPGTSNMVTDANGATFIVTDGQARYTSALHFGEINVRREWCDGLTLLAGFRMGELNELYSANGTGAHVAVPISLNANTFNHLYGFQLGADYEFYNMGGPLRVSALCKAGIYGNSAMQSIHQVETGVSDQTLDAHRNQAAFMGEAGLVATYELTRHVSVRASYQAVWIEGVALAPEQIGATNFTTSIATIDTHGGVFYQGGGLGLEVKF